MRCSESPPIEIRSLFHPLSRGSAVYRSDVRRQGLREEFSVRKTPHLLPEPFLVETRRPLRRIWQVVDAQPYRDVKLYAHSRTFHVVLSESREAEGAIRCPSQQVSRSPSIWSAPTERHIDIKKMDINLEQPRIPRE